MLEVPFFEKLEQLKMATNGEGRQWLRGLPWLAPQQFMHPLHVF